tara:strand:+ start:569 stop:1240 length:672 start_codon:yes stop_codon:yes gene_type:complete
MERSKIIIIIPAKNEMKTIYEIVKKSKKIGKVLVVDDKSEDKTIYYAKKAGAIVIKTSQKNGYQAAILSGLKFAKKKKFYAAITMDADGQHKLSDLKKTKKFISQGYELVLGIRNLKGRFSEFIFNFITKKLSGISDVLCGLKGFRLDQIKFNDLNVDYFSICTFLPIYLKKNNAKTKQFKININNREDNSRFGSIFVGNIKILFAMILNMLFIFFVDVKKKK